MAETRTETPSGRLIMLDVPGWRGSLAGQINAAGLQAATFPPGRSPTVFVCGPTGFVETVASALVELGHDPQRVKTERFGGA